MRRLFSHHVWVVCIISRTCLTEEAIRQKSSVDNVETPEEEGQATSLGESLEYLKVGVIFRVTVEDTVLESEVESKDVLS